MSWRNWVTVAVLVALVGGILGVLRVQSGEAAIGDTHEMTIPAAAFIPTSDNLDYYNSGGHVSATGGASADFTAPLFFPVDLDHVRITKLIFWVYDNGDSSICLALNRTKPRIGDTITMASRCSDDASTTTPRRFATQSISPSTARSTTALYLWLNLREGVDYRFYGATIQWKEI